MAQILVKGWHPSFDRIRPEHSLPEGAAGKLLSIFIKILWDQSLVVLSQVLSLFLCV
jgi:hypothetical protein